MKNVGNIGYLCELLCMNFANFYAKVSEPNLWGWVRGGIFGCFTMGINRVLSWNVQPPEANKLLVAVFFIYYKNHSGRMSKNDAYGSYIW